MPFICEKRDGCDEIVDKITIYAEDEEEALENALSIYELAGAFGVERLGNGHLAFSGRDNCKFNDDYYYLYRIAEEPN